MFRPHYITHITTVHTIGSHIVPHWRHLTLWRLTTYISVVPHS